VSGVGLAALGVGAIAAGIGLGARSASDAKQISAANAQGDVPWDATRQSLYRDGQNTAVASTVTYVVGGVLAATGAVLTTIGLRDRAPRARHASSGAGADRARLRRGGDMRLLMLAAALAAGCTFHPTVSNGSFECGDNNACPPGFVCADDGRCYRPDALTRSRQRHLHAGDLRRAGQELRRRLQRLRRDGELRQLRRAQQLRRRRTAQRLRLHPDLVRRQGLELR